MKLKLALQPLHPNLLGFDENANPITKVVTKTGQDADIAVKSTHFLPLKTSVHGVLSGMIDYALMLVNSRNPQRK